MDTTRRYPRTLEEAFGPYQRGQIWTKPEPMHPADRTVVIACAAAAIALVVILAVWG